MASGLHCVDDATARAAYNVRCAYRPSGRDHNDCNDRYCTHSALSLAATAGLIFFAHTAPAAAEEQTLQFKLVTQQVGVPSALPEVGGHKITVGQYMGVAIFEDGRIAHKRFVNIDDDTAEAGSFKGYSTYTFEDGHALTLSYTGGWNADGVAGTYEVISGTGKFAGATGTGSFKAEDEPWDEAMLLDVSLDLTLATQ